jgi:hypothetical protein
MPSTDHIWKIVMTIWNNEYTGSEKIEEEGFAAFKSYLSKAPFA